MVLPLTCKLNISVKSEVYQALEEKAKSLHKDEEDLIAEALEWYLSRAPESSGDLAPHRAPLLKRRS